MESEISLMHPEIIMYSIVLAGLILLFWRRRKKFKKGVIVANTKYVKKTGYFKILNAKYHLYNILIKGACILLILVYAVLSARLYEVKKHDEEFNNRDIMLCMDFSGSVNALNRDIVDTMKQTVESLKDERFGITIFDNAPITLVPLTTDYNYVLHTLDIMKSYLENTNTSSCRFSSNPTEFMTCLQNIDVQNIYLNSIFKNGIRALKGSSLIGDGVAACANTFKTDVERTKIIILTTDNMVAGSQIISVPEAAAYAKSKGIKVYPIGTKSIEKNQVYKQGLIDLATTTDGKYYDYSKYSTDQINNEIEQLNKNAIKKTTYVTTKELPELIVPYLLYILPILLLLDWRVRI